MTQRFKAEVKRHHPKMPRFILVPPAVAEAFGKCATFVVNVRFGDLKAVRKSIKPWGDGKRWFMDLPAAIFEKLGVDTGATIAVEIEPVAEAVPKVLSDAIREAGVLRAWLALTEPQRRMSAEHIYSAKRPETMQRRVGETIAKLRTWRPKTR